MLLRRISWEGKSFCFLCLVASLGLRNQFGTYVKTGEWAARGKGANGDLSWDFYANKSCRIKLKQIYTLPRKTRKHHGINENTNGLIKVWWHFYKEAIILLFPKFKHDYYKKGKLHFICNRLSQVWAVITSMTFKRGLQDFSKTKYFCFQWTRNLTKCESY